VRGCFSSILIISGCFSIFEIHHRERCPHNEAHTHATTNDDDVPLAMRPVLVLVAGTTPGSKGYRARVWLNAAGGG
jgi:hypothetical protein